MKIMFAILIPVYNSANFLQGCLDSILVQTFEHYQVLLYDDGSADGSNIVCQDYVMYNPEKFKGIENWDRRRFTGGARNFLLEHCPNAEYVLFMDGDDKLVHEETLQKVYDFTLEQGCPDVVRLSYNKKDAEGVTAHILTDTSPAEMAANSKVAPWTKMVKRTLLKQAPFPENTLFEDVSQHLLLADKAETVASTYFPVIEWNRCNVQSASAAATPKRKSSAFRFVADLMDLDLTKPYTVARRDLKVRSAAKNLGMDFDKIDWKKVCC